MHLTEHERQTIQYYDENAASWALQRKKLSEPSFWGAEYTLFVQRKMPRGRLLEIGSGSGREALEFLQMGYAYTGIDTSQELLKIAQKTAPAAEFLYATVYHLPFPENTFDAFSSWAMLPHVPKAHIDEALASIRKTLTPDAIGFLAMREGEGEKREEATGRWFSYYLPGEFELILEKNGFAVTRTYKKPSRIDLVWLVYFVEVIPCERLRN